MVEIKTNSVYILSLQAKDVYISNNLESDMDKIQSGKKIKGYITKIANNQYNTKKYVNAIDQSLDLIKFREIHEKIFKKNKFSFFNKNGKEFSNKIINVNFDYSVKEYNKFGKNIYIKFGYIFKDINLLDSIYIKDGVLLGIELNKKVANPISEDLLGEYFEYNKELQEYSLKRTSSKNKISYKNIKNILSVKELRNHLYKNGFYVNGMKFVRYKRSSGSSRVGKCLFMQYDLYKEMHKHDLCGLDIKKGEEIDLAALESYISLTSSSIIDTIKIKKENILIIEDYYSIFKDDVITTKIIDGKLFTQEENAKIKNSIFDGQSLMDESMFEKYPDRGMLLLRQRFFKTCAFNTNIQKFFIDNNITNILQLNGFTFAKNIQDIKLITTPSSIKYLKFGKLEDWLNIIEEDFGCVKYEKPTNYFDGNLVQSHYQLINTLQFTKEEMKDFLYPTIEYIKMLRDDPNVVKHHIKYPKNGIEIDEIKSKNDIIFKLLGINSKFSETKLYDDFKKDLIKSFIKNSRNGHIYIKGNYSVICGNPFEMLKHSVGEFDGSTILEKDTIYCKNFKDNEEIIGVRSPHICSANILITKNKKYKYIDEYFNFSTEIVCVNSIDSNLLEKFNGADFDSDQILLSNNQLLIDIAKRNYDKFKIPTNFVEAKKINRFYTLEQQADLDICTSKNLIGEIINLSQELNSIMWHNLNKNPEYDFKEIYLDICKLAIASCIEIDKAKKEFDINMVKELDIIKKKYRNKTIKKVKGEDINYNFSKPNFLKRVTINNGYTPSSAINYKNYNTAMDFLNSEFNSFLYSQRNITKKHFIKIGDIVNTEKYVYSELDHKQRYRILELVSNLKNNISEIWNNDNIGYYEKRDSIEDLKKELINRIKNLKLNDTTIISLIKASFENKLLLQVFFNCFDFWDYFYDESFITDKKVKERIYLNFGI